MHCQSPTCKFVGRHPAEARLASGRFIYVPLCCVCYNRELRAVGLGDAEFVRCYIHPTENPVEEIFRVG